MYRTALIGCGNIASLYANDLLIKGIYTHAGAYAACSDTELVAVCDIDEVKAASCAKKWNIPAFYTKVEQLIEDQEPEIISICTPDKTHADVLNIILKTSGIRAILAEKPLALDEHQAQGIILQAKKKGVLLAVNYSRRYSKAHQKIKDLIQAKYIGNIQKVTGFYTKGILHNGSHWLDLARWLIGEVKSVQGFYTDKQIEADPTLDAWLMFENGAIGALQGLSANAFSLFEMDIIGTEGRIRLVDSGHRIEYFEVIDSPFYSGYKTLQKNNQEEEIVSNTLLNAVTDLVMCLEKTMIPKCSGEDGVAVLQIALALIKSAEEGIKINLV